jgi:hypothetical protein
MTTITGTLHEDQYAFLIISRSVHPKNEKRCNKVVEKIKTHILCSITFSNHAVYEIIWNNMVQPGRPQITIWRMRIACWINKATIIHPEYIILIVVPLQWWLHECASVLHNMYITYLVCTSAAHLLYTLFNWFFDNTCNKKYVTSNRWCDNQGWQRW